ncbi:Transcription termination factor, mitochondrial/chloroplastic [Sesbania bispinosa]|nr:Transcription termination factor, mitochondrial/chloroplastic [Sesbania bispinosa]
MEVLCRNRCKVLCSSSHHNALPVLSLDPVIGAIATGISVALIVQSVLVSMTYCEDSWYPSQSYISKSLAENVKLLIDNGVASSNISRILRLKPYVLCSTNLGKIVQEVKDLGFDPSKSYSGDALLAKRATRKSKWDEKIDTYKRWGWSEETILEAFKKQPQCMLRSSDKINRVMQFWVNQLGWDFSYLVKAPGIFFI